MFRDILNLMILFDTVDENVVLITAFTLKEFSNALFLLDKLRRRPLAQLGLIIPKESMDKLLEGIRFGPR